jgi:hypothetical protein
MAFLVEDGNGLTTSNSYVAVADADTFHADRGNTAWADADTTDRQAALINAADYLDATYAFIGCKKLEDQAMDWPRYDAVDPDGFTILDSVVPTVIKEAAMVLALEALSGDLLSSSTDGAVKSLRVVVDVIEEETEYFAGTANRQKVFSLVQRMLRGWHHGGQFQVPLRRV